MKYLYLLIRHLFPRHRWKIISTTKLYDESVSKERPVSNIIVLQDQFGNIKKKKIH